MKNPAETISRLLHLLEMVEEADAFMERWKTSREDDQGVNYHLRKIEWDAMRATFTENPTVLELCRQVIDDGVDLAPDDKKRVRAMIEQADKVGS